jgi:tubby-related protein 1
MNQTDFKQKSPNYLGKVTSNFMGTEFNLYDPGLNPSKKSATEANVREQMGTFLYVSST